MTIYFSLILVVTIFMSIAQVAKQNAVLSKLFIFFTFLSLIFVPGFRSSNVGTDTNNYVGSFNSYDTINTSVLDMKTSREIGYLVLEKIARKLHHEYWMLLLFIAVVTVYFNLKVITQLSYNYGLSIFVFITLGSYLFFFNGARQGLAAAIYGMAIIQVINGNFKKYVFWVFAAFLFHKTVLIMLPLYFLFRREFSTKNLILTTVGSILFIGSMGFLLRLFPDSFSIKYTNYEGRGATGAVLLTTFYVIITTVFIFIRRFIKSKDLKQYDIYLNMTIFNTLIYALVYFMGLDINIVRLSLFVSLGFILIWPIIFRNLQLFKALPIRLVFFVTHLIFFYIYISKMSNLVPYVFNPTLFNN